VEVPAEKSKPSFILADGIFPVQHVEYHSAFTKNRFKAKHEERTIFIAWRAAHSEESRILTSKGALRGVLASARSGSVRIATCRSPVRPGQHPVDIRRRVRVPSELRIGRHSRTRVYCFRPRLQLLYLGHCIAFDPLGVRPVCPLECSRHDDFRQAIHQIRNFALLGLPVGGHASYVTRPNKSISAEPNCSTERRSSSSPQTFWCQSSDQLVAPSKKPSRLIKFHIMSLLIADFRSCVA
jgi:hypothetical protein